jgi:hypothetical protein
MKKRFNNIIDWLFYDFLSEIIEEQFSITVFLKVGEDIIKETTMKHLPRKGDYIEFSLPLKRDSLIFEVEKITIMQFGSVAYLNGKII